MRKTNSIRTQIILFLLIGSLVSLLLGFCTNYSSLDKALHENERLRVLAAAKTVQHVLDMEANTLQLLASNLGTNNELSAGLILCIVAGDFVICRESLDRLLPEFSGRRLVVTDAEGRALYSHDENVPIYAHYNVRGIDEALEGETVFSAGLGPDGWAMRIIIPLIQDKTIVGALVLARVLDSTLLEQLAHSVDIELAFITLDGLMTSSKTVSIKPQPNDDLIEDILLHRSDDIIIHNRESECFTFYGSIRLADQLLCLVLYKINPVVHSQLDAQRMSLIQSSLLLFVTIMITGILFTGNLIRPLQNLCRKTERVINTLGTQTKMAGYGGNEVKITSNAFEILEQTLQEHLTGRQEAEDKLADNNKKLQLQMDELRESKQYLANIFSSMDDGIFVFNVDGIICSLNHKSCALLGCSEEKVIGLPFNSFVEDEDWQDNCFTGRNSETRLRCIDGHFVDILLSGAVLKEEYENLHGFICVVKDITDIKKARKREKKQEVQMAHSGRLAALGEMSTGIAHEINQPLTIIRLASQYLKQELGQEKDERVNTTIQKIIDQIDRVTRIIKNMRAFARADNDPGVGPTDCALLIDKALFFFREQFRVRSIDLKVDLDQNLPDGLVNGQQLQQIVVNLLSNARNAVEEQADDKGRDYQMVVNVNLQRAPGNQAVLEIRDNGIGMSAEVKERCFDSFFTTKEEGKGTGLGLSIVKTLAKASQMTLSVESEPGCGCSFQLSYSLVDATEGRRKDPM